MSQFFAEISDQSEVKSEIVSKYFGSWSKIMNAKSRSQRLAYIDLFSGPGRYSDGSKSTPIKVLEYCLSQENLSRKIVTIFNDADPLATDSLTHAIDAIPNINHLRYKPVVNCSVVGEDLIRLFERTRLIPTLAFVDPFGYKGLSSKLIAALIKDWGSDCIFFFNYNRINAGINNPKVVGHMNSIFGEERANLLRNELEGKAPEDRELLILNELAESLSLERNNFVLPFRFIRANGVRTSHYLIFVSKHVLGYKIMKDIMYAYSSEYVDGVASFSYIPVGERQLSLLSSYSQPTIQDLMQRIMQSFQGVTLTAKQIFDMNHVGTPFVFKNYQEALGRLETESKISVDPPFDDRPRRKGSVTFSEKVIVTFPK